MMESGQENKSVTNKIALNVNEPFLNQTEYKKIIEDYSNIPIPEVTLHRLLSLAKASVRKELAKRTQETLVDLEIYIRFYDKEKKELGENYTFNKINRGEIDTIEPDTGEKENRNEEIDDSQWSLPINFIDSLGQRLAEVIIEDMSPEELSKREPVVGFFCILASTPPISVLRREIESRSLDGATNNEERLRAFKTGTGMNPSVCCPDHPRKFQLANGDCVSSQQCNKLLSM